MKSEFEKNIEEALAEIHKAHPDLPLPSVDKVMHVIKQVEVMITVEQSVKDQKPKLN